MAYSNPTGKVMTKVGRTWRVIEHMQEVAERKTEREVLADMTKIRGEMDKIRKLQFEVEKMPAEQRIHVISDIQLVMRALMNEERHLMAELQRFRTEFERWASAAAREARALTATRRTG